ncbi:MAG TPA: hypothetical protein VLA14_16775 [Polyangia bacterium]|jgi:hypothetical protein|nr:hypothetical protein [Polyangia bacterium]
MTPCDQIGADAVGVAALPTDAPERVSAEAHAGTCASCAGALEDGRRLLALLGQATVPGPSAAALARASAAILSELDAPRAVAGKLAAVVSAAVLATWALPLALMRAPLAGRALLLSIALAAAAAVSSALTIAVSKRDGLLFLAASLAMAFVTGSGSTLGPAVGLHCAAIEAMTAATAGGAAWVATRALGQRAMDRRVLVGALGGGALAGHAALDVGCGMSSALPHVLVFHTGPVVLALGVALLLANRGGARASSANA